MTAFVKKRTKKLRKIGCVGAYSRVILDEQVESEMPKREGLTGGLPMQVERERKRERETERESASVRLCALICLNCAGFQVPNTQGPLFRSLCLPHASAWFLPKLPKAVK